ncbi:tyrosine-type recombinase/integrase [bacterium]|nr:tyrosine-type recombinase/integrase [Verrucomicrobiales bacterium]MDC0311604.1 tyrosine-type recombinase/integrase [bacterium]MDC0322492.1 tyrosine-type recombinase/integrase [Verrucomicrobiales bacterium]
MDSEPSKEPVLVKVAECLYRNRSSGTYFALVKRKGKQIRKSLKTKDRKLAERRLREFRTKASRLTADSAERKTPFKILAKRWLTVHNSNLKASTAERYVRCVKELDKFFGEIPVSEITKRQCEDWMTQRAKGIAASTFNTDALVLKAVLDYAVRDGLILDNPANVIKRRRSKAKEIVIPTREEYEKLLEAIDQLDGRAGQSKILVQLLALSGMRLGEATRIEWREIDFKKEQFTVSGGEIGTKNGETRVVPLFPRLKLFLENLRPVNSTDPRSPIITIESTKSALGSACKTAQLPHFTHHSLRHFFVSNAIEVGVDFKSIAAWIGHKDGGILVAQTYGHLREAHSQQMASLL